jgi:hypothetical protein
MAFRVYVESPLADVHVDAIEADLRKWLADAVATDARRYAPRDTGFLKHHGIVVAPDNRRVTAIGAGMPPNADAPAYVEYGTRPHPIPNAFGLGITVQHPGTDAQPFLRPAAYRNRAIPPWVVKARANLADR